jgi:ATP-dependent Clp protease ATP-binding subunit ClpX
MHFQPPSFYMKAMEQVVSQRDLKRKLAFAFSGYTLFLDDASVGRAVPLVYGPSGSGKTYAVELCAKASKLPYTVLSAAGTSAAGYKGITLRDLLAQHFIRFGQSEGVIFMDEIDKKKRGAMRTTDGEQLAMATNFQAELLRYVEHEDVYLQDEAKDIKALRVYNQEPENEDDEDAWEPVCFETRRAMWVLAGAFDRLELLIKQRLQVDHLMDDDQLWEKTSPEDFRRYGVTPELINRCDVVAWVKPLKGHEMIEILEVQEVPKLVKMFNAIGCKLDLDAGALSICAQLAIQEKTGARGAVLRLRHVISDVYTEADEHQLTSCKVDARVMTSGHLEFQDASAA